LTDRDTSQNHGLTSDPCIVFDLHSSRPQVHTVRVSAAKYRQVLRMSLCGPERMGKTVENVHLMRNQDPISDKDFQSGPEAGLLTHKAVLAYSYLSAVPKNQQLTFDDRFTINAYCIATAEIVD
jgi:hypothetical protein